MRADAEISIEGKRSLTPEGTEPGPAILTKYGNDVVLAIEILKLDARQFCDAHACIHEQPKDGEIRRWRNSLT